MLLERAPSATARYLHAALCVDAFEDQVRDWPDYISDATRLQALPSQEAGLTAPGPIAMSNIIVRRDSNSFHTALHM